MFSLDVFLDNLTAKKAVFILIAIGLIVYSNFLFNGFTYDDFDSFVRNPLMHNLSTIPSFFTNSYDSAFLGSAIQSYWGSFYRPLAMSTMTMIASTFGVYPFWYNLIGIVLHISNSILLLLILKKFLRVPAGFILALIFLVHPLNTEAVAHIGISDLMFSFFGLLAFIICLYFPLSIKNIFLQGFLLFLSLLSKESGILFIGVILFYILLYQKKRLMIYTPIFITYLGFYLFLRLKAVPDIFHRYDYSPILNASFFDRLLTIPKIVSYYLGSVTLPLNLAIAQNWIVKDFSFYDFYLPLLVDILFLSGLILAGFYILKRNKILFKFYLLGSFWLIAGLSIHLNLYPLVTTVASRWFYFPFMGLLIITGVIIASIKIKPRFREWLTLSLIVLLMFWSIRTIFRTFDFRDNLSLYTADLNTLGTSYFLENNLGDEYSRMGNLEKAKFYFENSTKNDPKGWINWNNLGNSYLFQNDTEQAKMYYLKSIENSNGTFELAYQNLAYLYTFKESTGSAKIFLQSAIKKFPDNFYLWRMLALTEKNLNNRESAKKAAEKSLEIFPDEAGRRLYGDILIMQ